MRCKCHVYDKGDDFVSNNIPIFSYLIYLSAREIYYNLFQ